MFSGFRVFLLVVMVLLPSSSRLFAQSEDENGAFLAAAMTEAHKGNWTKAAGIARRVSDPVAGDIIEWMRLRDGGATWPEYMGFLKTHVGWPNLGTIKNRAEGALPENFTPQQVIAYFDSRRPRTGQGVLRLTEALSKVGRTSDAQKEAIRAWRQFAMTKDERVRLLAKFEKTLKPHHVARLDMLLWRNLSRQAKGLYTLVPKGYPELARARLGLRKKVNGVDRLIAAVPKALKNDPGLAYERFRWRAQKNKYDAARDLLIERSVSAAALGRPERWAGTRRSIARQEMRDGYDRRAYLIASHHFLKSGSDYADLEWLSGYLALQKLNNPSAALYHFNRFRDAIATPISYGRAGYWQGRAYEALGDKQSAIAAYAFAAGYQTSFYGQLAAEKIGALPDASLNGRERSPDGRLSGFSDLPIIRAALLLNYANEPNLSERFLRTFAKTLDRQGLQQLADLTMDIGRPNFAVRLSKQAAKMGFVLPKTYFPLTDVAKKKLKVPPEVAMSITRRESELNPKIISPAGARGLMQLMPTTARKVARELGLKYSKSRLTSDWQYNVTLGSAYLADQLAEFNGSYILAFAAYNAGPHRAKRWIERYGDPRQDSVDQIDWIEHIPFRETRNYVMRVIESMHVYRARISGHTQPLRISKDLKKG